MLTTKPSIFFNRWNLKIITLKDLRENGNNKEELSESTEYIGQNTSEDDGTSDNLEDDKDYLALMLLCFIWMQEHENEKLWKNFQEDRKHNSRFFTNKSDYYLKNKEVVAIYEKLNELFPNMKLELEDVKSDSAMNIISIALGRDMDKMQKLRQIITETEAKEKPFWGFNEENCDAPPKENAVAGRANSVGISFLYAASDQKTAIMEMRPQIGQYFNVCKIEICRNILIFDFTYTANELKEDETTKSGDLYAISKEFSYPNYGNPEDYIPTQYLCEYLRQKGFDGIRYKSSVSSEGTNLIIFDTNSDDKPYKILESRIFEVENIDIKFEQIIPIEPNGFLDLQKKE